MTAASAAAWLRCATFARLVGLRRKLRPAIWQRCAVCRSTLSADTIGARLQARAYCARKVGIARQTRALAMDHSAKGIRVNGVDAGHFLMTV